MSRHRILSATFILLLSLAPLCAGAASVSLALHEQPGFAFGHPFAFDLGREFLHVSYATVTLRGTYTGLTIECDEPGGTTTYVAYSQVEGYLGDDADANESFMRDMGAGPETTTQIEETFTLNSADTGIAAYLLDGRGTIYVDAGFWMPGDIPSYCSPGIHAQTIVLTEAILTVEGDSIVPADDGTWGRIKAIYR